MGRSVSQGNGTGKPMDSPRLTVSTKDAKFAFLHPCKASQLSVPSRQLWPVNRRAAPVCPTVLLHLLRRPSVNSCQKVYRQGPHLLTLFSHCCVAMGNASRFCPSEQMEQQQPMACLWLLSGQTKWPLQNTTYCEIVAEDSQEAVKTARKALSLGPRR